MDTKMLNFPQIVVLAGGLLWGSRLALAQTIVVDSETLGRWMNTRIQICLSAETRLKLMQRPMHQPLLRPDKLSTE